MRVGGCWWHWMGAATIALLVMFVLGETDTIARSSLSPIIKSVPLATKVCDISYNRTSADLCEYVRQECKDMQKGLFSYMEIYYCGFTPELRFIPAILLITWLLLLFVFVGTASSEFFCPNLSSLAAYWNMSESLAGVTLLAIGNGSPDLFSTFSAFSSGAGGMALGELIGASTFIITMVIGSVAYFAPFTLPKGPFLRDVLFFTGAALIILLIEWDRSITFEESISLVLYYLLYVGTVAVSDWISSSQSKQKPLRRTLSSTTPEIAVRGVYLTATDSDESIAVMFIYEADNEKLPLLSQKSHNPVLDMSGNSSSSRTGHLLDIEEDRLSDCESSFHAKPTISTSLSYQHHKSLIDAVEIYNYLRHSYPSPNQQLAPSTLLSSNFSQYTGVNILHDPRLFLYRRPSRDKYTTRINSRGSGASNISFGGYDTLQKRRGRYESLSQSLGRRPLSLSISISKPSNECINELSHVHSADDVLLMPVQQQLSHQPLLNVPICHSPISLTADENNIELDIAEDDEDSHTPTTLLSILIPLTYVWRHKSAIEKLAALIVTPVFVLLRLTVPVIDLDNTVNKDKNKNGMNNETVHDECTAVQTLTPTLGENIPLAPAAILNSDKERIIYQRLFIVQIFLATCLITCTIFEWIDLNDNMSWLMVLVMCVVPALIVSLIVFRAVTRRPTLQHSICFVWFSFLVAIVWVYIIANEVVSVLKTLGKVFNISDSMLGLTVFAVGNSLGDFIANVTMAKMGYPTMAVAASYASPMLNLVMGVGLSTTWLSLKNNGMPIPLEVNSSVLVANISLLCVLVICVFAFPLMQYRFGKGVSKFLMGCYVAVITTAITYEVLHG